MRVLESANRTLGAWLIRDFDNTTDRNVRVRHGMLAGWLSISANVLIFSVKLVLGLMAGSISVVADAFHLVSHLANSVVLVVSFWITSRPATAKTPFGHGRMEHVAPLIMSVILFVTGIQIGERAVHQMLDPHEVHYWPALPWILLASIVVKECVGQFVSFLGERVDSHAILANARHHRIEAVMTLTVVAGLVAGHHYHRPELDGCIGILMSLWLLYMGYQHGREAIVPLLGQAPSKEFIAKIRAAAKSVNGIEDAHEIIVHDYGALQMLSLHAEIPETLGALAMHEVSERCEAKLRDAFGCEAVCHTDPLMEMTPELRAVEDAFKSAVNDVPHITGYHDFRVIGESDERVIIAADIDVDEHVADADLETIPSDLESRVKSAIANVAYCTFYVTPKFSY